MHPALRLPETPCRPLEARDVILLSLLGLLAEGAMDQGDLVDTARRLGGRDWQPTTEVIAGTMDSARNHGWIALPPGQVTGLAQITESGRIRFQELLVRPIPPCAALARIQVTMLACFVETAPATLRPRLIANMTAYYQAELAGVPTGCQDCPHPLRRRAAQERRRILAELGWLERIDTAA